MYTKEISDKKIWEEFLTKSKIPTSFFQSWNWGEFQKSLGKNITRMGFFDDNDELFGIGLGVIILAKRGKYLYFRNGPVASWKALSQSQFIVEEIKKKAKELGLWFVRVSPHVTLDSDAGDFLKEFKVSPMFDVDALDTWILDITQSEEDILANMRKNTRYEINRARRDGVEIEKTQKIEDIEKFYPIYQDTVKRQQWIGYSIDYIKSQFKTFVEDDSATLFLAKYKGEYIAGSIFVYHTNTSYYHYSGALTKTRKIHAPALIQWHNILEAKSRGLSRYNFWGIAPENKQNHPWKGLSFFKMGFGGFAERWLPTRDLPVSKKYWFTHLVELYDKKKKGY